MSAIGFLVLSLVSFVLPAFSFEHAATRWWWSLRRLSCLGPLLALCVLLVARRWIAPWWHDDAWLEHFAFLVWAPLAALVLLREPLVDAERVVSRLNLGTFAAALAFALVSATPLETWWIRPVSIRVVWLSLGALATLVPLRREVARAWARAGRGPRAALALLLVAGALVSGTEFAAWWRLSTVPPTTVAIYRLGWGAYSLNVALLLAAGAVVPARRYAVTGDRELTTVLTVHDDGKWELVKGTLYDVTHLPCRSARYTGAACTPTGCGRSATWNATSPRRRAKCPPCWAVRRVTPPYPDLTPDRATPRRSSSRCPTAPNCPAPIPASTLRCPRWPTARCG